ncbi:hypothetical protein [Clostridium kluyveri]|uniref:Uncharacterized protein n=1 Tax=Clostridium kluyveri (strain ATCC 8527 / DSM 555 / NBRC 12016 / NCIMB 10680 / K1) TaxID=431943 RepID=A5MYG9_CLOK5|nr:hypothetical protein [Clostridium kluyveri]EDK33915.1 Hypothetical protein CKL_1903 [Clostridium kluyveri DSM 555]EDK34007.1 Hypothetical protein CKL_1995 [Clostridium kluyveri DSM 555]
MWIRSQDRKLLADIKAIGAYSIEIRASIGGNRADTGPLGEYESEERAVEVLDEIQESLWDCLNVDENVIAKVYEMPEK